MIFFEVRGVRLSIKRISICLSFNFSLLLVVMVEESAALTLALVGVDEGGGGGVLSCTPGSEGSSSNGLIPARNCGIYCHSYTSLGLCRGNKGDSFGWASTESMRKTVPSRSGDGQGGSATGVEFVMGSGS